MEIMSCENQNFDIYAMNLKTEKIHRITNNPSNQVFPDVWGDYVVWQDNRNSKDGQEINDIYLYHLSDGVEKKISQTIGDHREPVIADGKVVWVDHNQGRKDFILYDIASDKQEVVSSKGAKAYGVEFDGQVIAWMDFRDGDSNIYIYDINQQKEIQLTFGAGDELDPVVSDGKVAWMLILFTVTVGEKDINWNQIRLI